MAKRSDDARFAAPPSGMGGSGSGPLPIGVPRDYVVSRPGEPRQVERRGDLMGVPVRMPNAQVSGDVQVAPLYYDGDEYTPSTLPVEDQARLQLALRAAGVYSPNEKFRLGVWDSNTRSAYRKLLEFANGAGLPWQEALRRYGSEAAGGGEMEGREGGGRAPLVRRQSNAMELAQIYESTKLTRTGRKASAAEVSKFVNTYLAQESGQQTAAHNAAETGGTISDVMDPKLFAEQQAQADDPTGAFRQDAIDTFRELGDVLTGGGAFGGE